MNVMKFIIGATFALLVACLFISYSSMKKGEVYDSAGLEIEQLKKRMANLEAAELKWSTRNQSPAVNAETLSQPTSTFTPQPQFEIPSAEQTAQTELERTQAELAKLKAARDEIEEQAAEVIEDALERIPATPTDKKAKRRATLIKSALLMARITSYNDAEKIASIQIESVGNVNTGDVLGIRRNSGIIGRLTIGMIEMDQGIADPIPGSFMGEGIDIQVGDELILPPDL